ncbi:MAG: hypothetical protein WBV06_06035 [Acidimicrobiia bacterium]
MGLTVGLFIAVAGCSSAGGDEQATTTTSDPAASNTTAVGVTDTTGLEPTTSGGDEPASVGSSDLPEMSGGSAAFTLAGEPEDFDWFVCFYGDAAVEMFGDEDVTFVGIGRRGGSFPSMDGVEAQIVASRSESALGTNYTILYTRVGNDGAQTNWQDVGSDAVQLQGDRVTFQGELSRIIDNQPSDEFDTGALDATCSPNSIGSGE